MDGALYLEYYDNDITVQSQKTMRTRNPPVNVLKFLLNLLLNGIESASLFVWVTISASKHFVSKVILFGHAGA